MKIMVQPGIDPGELPFPLAEQAQAAANIPSFHTEYVSYRDDPLVNNYNPELISAWRANVDIKLITDPHLMVIYISKYTTKAETASQTFGDLFKTVSSAKFDRVVGTVEQMNDHSLSRLTNSIAASMLMQMSAPRDVSIQEAVRHIAKIPIVISSFSYQSVNLARDLAPPLLDAPSSREFEKFGPVQLYEGRAAEACEGPLGAVLDNMTLKQFYGTFNATTSSAQSLKVLRTQLYSRWTASGQLNHARVQTSFLHSGKRIPRKCIPHFIPSLIHNIGSVGYAKYCKLQLLKNSCWKAARFYAEACHKPELDEGQPGIDHDLSIIEAWHAYVVQHPYQIMLSRTDNLLQMASLLSANQLLHLIDTATPGIEEYVPPPEYESYEQMIVPDTFVQAMNDGLHGGESPYELLLQTESIDACVDTSTQIEEHIANPALSHLWIAKQKLLQQVDAEPPVVLYEQLNSQQRTVFDFVAQINEDGDGILMLVHGTAGTGKSFLINALSTAFAHRVLRMAPTGVAASNICGSTIHATLAINPKSAYGDDQELEESKSLNARAKLMNRDGSLPNIIIIDEISMVDKKLFGMINARCQQLIATGDNKEKPFGNCTVLLFGDFGQIPPVNGSSLIAELPSTSGSHSITQARQIEAHHLFGQFIKVELTQVMRQDDPTQASWRQVLLRLRSYKLEQEDVEFLSQRFSAMQDHEVFRTSVHLYSRNHNVDQRSISIWRHFSERLLLQAHHPAGGVAAQTATHATADRLMHPLPLAIDMPVSISWNLWTESGIVNGSRGVLKGFAMKPSSNGSAPVGVVNIRGAYVQMDTDYSGPSISSEIPRLICVPLKTSRFAVRSGSRRIQCLRRQLPLLPDVARTIHKSQGLTLPTAVIEMGEGLSTHGLAFVALSRTKRVEDMMIAPFDTVKFTKEGRRGVWPGRLEAFMNQLATQSAEFFEA